MFPIAPPGLSRVAAWSRRLFSVTVSSLIVLRVVESCRGSGNPRLVSASSVSSSVICSGGCFDDDEVLVSLPNDDGLFGAGLGVCGCAARLSFASSTSLSASMSSSCGGFMYGSVVGSSSSSSAPSLTRSILVTGKLVLCLDARYSLQSSVTLTQKLFVYSCAYFVRDCPPGRLPCICSCCEPLPL